MRDRGSQRSGGSVPAVVLLPMPELAPTGLGVVRGLGRAGVPVIAVSDGTRSLSLRSRYVVGTWTAPHPQRDGEGFFEALRSLAEELDERVPLFATTDAQVQLIHGMRGRLQDAYRYPFLKPDMLELCTDKARTAALSEATGVPAPVTVHVDDSVSRKRAMDADILPAIIKPTRWARVEGDRFISYEQLRSAWGVKAVRASSGDELSRALSIAADLNVPVVVQEEIPGPSSSIFVTASYSDEAGQALAMFTGRKTRQLPSDVGTGTMLESMAIEELGKQTEKLLGAARICGQADTEYKLDRRDGLYKLMEINPRPATWNGIAAASGVNCHYAAYLDLLGQEVPESTQKDGVKWIDGWPDLKYLLKYRNGDHTGAPLRIGDYLSSLSGRRVWAYWSLTDPLPGAVRTAQIVGRQVSKLGGRSARRGRSEVSAAIVADHEVE